MRTTIDIPDPLYRRAKAAAALRGEKFKTFISDALEDQINRVYQTSRKKGKRIKHPLIPSKEPGSLHLTNAMIEEILTMEDARALTRH